MLPIYIHLEFEVTANVVDNINGLVFIVDVMLVMSAMFNADVMPYMQRLFAAAFTAYVMLVMVC